MIISPIFIYCKNVKIAPAWFFLLLSELFLTLQLGEVTNW